MEMNSYYFRLHKSCLYCLCCFLLVSKSYGQICENQALAFLGADLSSHHISCNLSSPINSNFTIEARFYTTNTSNLNWSLFSLTGSGSNFFELSYSINSLFFYWDNGTNPLSGVPIVIPTANFTGACHHLAVSRNGSQVAIYIDGILVSPLIIVSGPFNFNQFFAGHSTASLAFDWHGQMDEIRLWNSARSAGDIQSTKDCTLQGSHPSLIINWPLNQGNTPNGPNTGTGSQTIMALDVSGNNNNGSLIGFNLPSYDPASNWVCNHCPPKYNVEITDRPSLFPVFLTSICSGDAAHFCITENGIPVNGINKTILWQFSDDLGATWTPPWTPSVPFSNLFCYQNPSIDVTAPCQTSTSGIINRKYRAIIETVMGTLHCQNFTSEIDLQIFCPVSGLQLTYSVNSPPTQFNNSICEGPVDIDFTLVNLPLFLNPVAPGLNINWSINGSSPICQNMTTCNYTINPAVYPNFPVQVTIQNGPCPPQVINLNLPVDRMPVCGAIDQMSGLASISPYYYEICPGQDAILGTIGNFQNCNPVWQYHFDTDPPLSPNWQDLGGSNPIQLTNILPQTSPPNNPLSPYLWPVPPTVPVKANCIIYRVKCTSPTLPASGCPPCTSNDVTICLRPEPSIPVITGGPQQFCTGGSSTLSINPVASAINYTWYWNGQLFANGPILNSIFTTMPGCYWVEVDDGCQKVTSQKFCIEECMVTALIGCPQDNPCACDGMPITLNGCDSFDSCQGTGPLTYSWYANGVFVGNGCQLVHTPDPNGSLYKLVVTNSLGCMGMKTLNIKPCM